MGITALLGGLGTIIGLIRALPQLARLLRAGHARGVSLDSAATSSVVSFGWAAYGLLTGQLSVTLATGSSGVVFAVIAALTLRLGHSASELRVAPLWLAVLLAVGALAGAGGLGVALPLSVLAANLPQIWVAFRARSLDDLSLGTWLLSMADGLTWGIYALIQGDLAIQVFGAFQLATSGLIVARKLARSGRRGAAGGEERTPS
ncbi:hypothetical protein F8S13_01435 [Chloroflexia bacterium SDU3-3]|nr:hypothetical protein F8S13_01435 [Chloroflexia bacterium SDU3-3]